MRRTSANLLLLLAGAIWGMGFVAQSSAMASIGPMLFLGLRFALACIALLPFAWMEQRRAREPLDQRMLAGFLACGTALFTAMTLQQYGLLTTTVTNSGFLTGLYVVFTPILTTLLMRKLPHPVIWPAAASALFGIWLLSGGSLVSLHAGDLLTVLSALFCAVQVMLIGIWAPVSGRPLALSLAQFLVCACLSLAGAFAVEPVVASQIMKALPEVLYAGVLSSGVAFTLQVVGQRYTTAPQAAIFLSSEALFAALFGALFLGERISPLRYLGCLFIFAAILTVELVPVMLARRKRPLARGGTSEADPAKVSHSPSG
ncbi:MAG: DMT family transporter [Pararhizobium sp.]